jgi:hypothetical protein
MTTPTLVRRKLSALVSAFAVMTGMFAMTGACQRLGDSAAACSPGEVAPCGVTVEINNESYTCKGGQKTCGSGGQWGACQTGDTVTIQSLTAPPAEAKALGDAGPCTDNPCDPYCQSVTDNGFGLDASGITPTPDGGIALTPNDGASGPGTSCTGLTCAIASCGGGGSTKVTGTAYAPNGTLPLYNVLVYVPNAPLSPLPSGATCDMCGAAASGSPITSALTDSHGNFTLNNVPSGTNIPLVIQLGKWRRQTTIPVVNPCVTNTLTDHNLTRLPASQSEGNMPKIAVTTGGCDRLSCMLPKVGIATSEYGAPGSSASVQFYGGNYSTAPFGGTPASNLWNSTATLMNYDMAIFSCECCESIGSDGCTATKNGTSFNAVTNYLAAGGRIFTTDFQYTWYKYSPDASLRAINGLPGGAPPGGAPVRIDTSFPKGLALSQWLQFIDPSTGGTSVTPSYVFGNMNGAIGGSNSQQWGYSPNYGSNSYYCSLGYWYYCPGNSTRFFTVNTPAGGAVGTQCGKAVHLDAHINQYDTVGPGFPSGCTGTFGQGEEAFAFFFFDLASCVSPTSTPPPTPPPYASSATFSRQYSGSCPVGQKVVWRFFDWETVTPGDSSISFSAQTASTTAGLSSAVAAPLGSASGATITSWVGADVESALNALTPKQTSQAYLQVNITLNPTTDKTQTPTLTAWRQTYDCVPAE